MIYLECKSQAKWEFSALPITKILPAFRAIIEVNFALQ